MTTSSTAPTRWHRSLRAVHLRSLGSKEIEMNIRSSVIAATFALLASAACGTEELCDAGDLAAALAAAGSGDTVSIGACAIEGTFTVPAGVTLEGRGAAFSALSFSDPQGAVLVVYGGANTHVRALRVETT